ncbi:MAG: hypothetical protein LBD45_07115 [Bacteroidales bacterium]|jgi:hypothetical protein|nr:hypothetical protein [Bacteroidales bacterium]
MKNRSVVSLLLGLMCCTLSAQTGLVKIDDNGRLTCTPDADGFVIPDFSYAGYHNGGVDIPDVPVVKEISPISGDNTAHIQSAIDDVGRLSKNAQGIRGALLLKAGKYDVSGTINVKYDGVILRGEGNGTSPSSSTIIYAKGNSPAQRDVIILGNTSQNKWNSKVSNTQKNITDAVVPVGSMSFSVTSATPFQVGDLIAVYHPCTAEWLNAVNRGGVPAPATGESDERWTVDQWPIIYHRYITAISGNKITIDAPVFYTLNNSLSQSYVYRINVSGTAIYREIGIENLRVDIESAGGEDESHAWQAIRFRSLENCWAKNVIAKGFGQSGFITDCCTRTTIEDCQAIDPVSIITGERRYNFNTYVYSQLILFKNCYASNGRHHYVSNGTSSASGNVFLNCISDAANSVSEGHRHWTQGMLYDRHREINLIRAFVLGLYNRVDMGTGHGWAAVHSVLWNCDVTSGGTIGLQKPPTAQNYAIGCTAKSITGKPVNDSNFPIGYVELQNQPVTQIPSLYLAQLNNRKQNGTVINPVMKENAPFDTIIGNGKITLDFHGLGIYKSVAAYNLQGQGLYRTKTKSSMIEIPASGEIVILNIETELDNYTTKICLK